MTMLDRRTLLAALAAPAVLASTSARAQTAAWPSRPVTFIVPFAPGGGTDAFARPLAAQLDTQGIRVIIENRAGAGGTVGASAAARATPDGATFFVGAAHHAIAPALYPTLDYDIERDLIPVGMISRPPQVIVVNPQRVQARTLQEFIAFARANPDVLNYGSAGSGTTHHLAGELFKSLTNTKITHVAYRGAGPALADLIAGHVSVMFDGLGSSASRIQAGQLRGIAVAAPARSPSFPDLPTAAESGLPGFDVATWYALWGPRGTPPEIMERMTRELRTALATPTIQEAWRRNGSDVPDIYGQAFSTFLKAEVERWGRVVRDGNIKLDAS